MLQSVPVSQPTGHGNQLQLIYEKSPGRSDPDFRSKIAKPNGRLIIIENKSPKQRFMSDHIGNILVCETTNHCFFLFVYFSAIMFIFFYVSGTILGLTFLHPDTIVKTSYLRFLCISETPTKLVVGCC